MTNLPSGLYAIILTPFKENGELDLAGLEAELEYAIEKKIHGAVVLGSNGEAPYLTCEEKKQVIKRTSEVARGKMALVAGAIAMGTREALEYAQLAKECGFDAVMVALPVYFHLDFEDVKRHYQYLAENSGIEITLYYVPECSGLVLQPEQIAELVSIPGINSMKLTSFNREFINQTFELCWEKDHDLFIGTSLLTYEGMKMGAQGCFCPIPLIAPEDMHQLFNLIQEKKWEQAFEVQEKIRLGGVSLFAGLENVDYETIKNGFMAIYNAPYSSPLSHTRVAHHILKEALRLKGLPITNQVRLPYQRVDEKKSDWIKKLLEDFGWL